jgi:hypothetical protein
MTLIMRTSWVALLLCSFAILGNADLLPKPGQGGVTLIDPEAPVQLSTAPVSEPPIRIKLPEPIAEKDQWRGVRCAVTEPRQVLFRHADKWESFWKKGMAPFSPKFAKVPPIDFTKEMVVGVFMGELFDPHYEIEIRSVAIEQRTRPASIPSTGLLDEEQGRARDETPTLVVRYRTIAKMSGVFTPPFAIQPFHLKRIPAFHGLIVFEEVRR